MFVHWRKPFIRARINDTLRVIFLFASLFINEREVKAIDCYVGYGQEGREYISGIEWPRKCPNTHYCFMAVTTDINKAKALIDFTWVSNLYTTVGDFLHTFVIETPTKCSPNIELNLQDAYYDLFYLKSCGGDYGTPLNTSSLPLGYFQDIKITVSPRLVTGQGGTELFSLKYTCTKNFCSSSTKHYDLSLSSVIMPMLLIGIGSLFLYF